MTDILQTDVAKKRERIEEAWCELAGRALRVVLIKKAMSYRAAASALGAIGVDETERSLEGKVHRGSFAFTFFLQVLVATKADCPADWRNTLRAEQSWEQRASSIVQRDMLEQRWLTYDVLSHSLRHFGVFVPAALLHTKIRDGTLSTALFLQYATVRGLGFVDSFLDWSDVNEVAAYGLGLFGEGPALAMEIPVSRSPSSHAKFNRWRWQKWPRSR